MMAAFLVLVTWTLPESNRPPPPCKSGALPDELRARVPRLLRNQSSPQGASLPFAFRRRGSTEGRGHRQVQKAVLCSIAMCAHALFSVAWKKSSPDKKPQQGQSIIQR